jgi:hypothetical protein
VLFSRASMVVASPVLTILSVDAGNPGGARGAFQGAGDAVVAYAVLIECAGSACSGHTPKTSCTDFARARTLLIFGTGRHGFALAHALGASEAGQCAQGLTAYAIDARLVVGTIRTGGASLAKATSLARRGAALRTHAAAIRIRLVGFLYTVAAIRTLQLPGRCPIAKLSCIASCAWSLQACNAFP